VRLAVCGVYVINTLVSYSDWCVLVVRCEYVCPTYLTQDVY